MPLRLNVAQARQIEGELKRSMAAGTDNKHLSERSFEQLEETYLHLTDVLQVELNETLWNESVDLRTRFIDRGEVMKYKAQDSDALGIALEELMSSELHRVLNHLPSELLHDAGFWRYLALFPFRWFVIEREPELKFQDYGGTDANRDKWLLIRAFQWGRKCYQAGDVPPYENATSARMVKRELKVSAGRIVDFYHSHIVRHRWADSAEVVHEFISATSRKPFINDYSQENRQVNELSKRVNRVVSNLSLLTMSTAEVKAIMEREKMAVLES
jgi:hypothetical protein